MIPIKNCAPFMNCITRISNTQVDEAHDIDVVMPMYNLIECSGNYSKRSGILWQYWRDEPVVDANDDIIDFNAANATKSFNLKAKITDQRGNSGTKIVEIMVPLKYLSNFLRDLEAPLINCNSNLYLKWSKKCVIMATNAAYQAATFSIIDTKFYVAVVTLSTQDNTKLL